MKTIKQAKSDCVSKLSRMLFGPVPGKKTSEMTPDELRTVREWLCTDETEKLLQAFHDLGEACAYEREKQIIDAIIG